MFKKIIAIAVASVALSATAADWREDADIRFTKEVPAFCGIKVHNDHGELNLRGEVDGKKAAFEVKHNRAGSGLATVEIKTESTNRHMDESKLNYTVFKEGAHISTGKSVKFEVNSRDFLEVSAQYDEDIENMLEGEAVIVTEVEIECN